MKNKDIVKEWVNKALDDELSINAIFKSKGAPGTICFLSQQMAEKFLKAFLISHNVDFPRVHHLERILGLCKKIDAKFSDFDEEVVLLSEYYIETRYPGDYPERFSWDDASKAYEAAIKDKRICT